MEENREENIKNTPNVQAGGEQTPHNPEPVYSHLKCLPAMLQMPSDMWCLPDYNRFVPDYTVHSDLRAAAGTAEAATRQQDHIQDTLARLKKKRQGLGLPR